MKILKKKRLLSASTTVLWQKWTTPEGLQSFMAKDCKVELRIGGPFELYFLIDNPPGLRGSEGCKILSYIPEQMLSFSWNAPPTIPTIRALGDVAWVVVEFESESPGETWISIQHLGFGEGPDWEQVYEYFDSAWEMVFDWLNNSISNKV